MGSSSCGPLCAAVSLSTSNYPKRTCGVMGDVAPRIDADALAAVQREHEVRLMSFLTDLAAAVRTQYPALSAEVANYVTADHIAKWAAGLGDVEPATRTAARRAVLDAARPHRPAVRPTLTRPTMTMPPVVDFVTASNALHRERSCQASKPLPVRPSVSTARKRNR